MGEKISKTHQPEGNYKFTKDNQPSPQAKSEGQKRRWKFKKMINEMLEMAIHPTEVDNLKKNNPQIGKDTTNMQAMVTACYNKLKKTGNTKALVDILKVSGNYTEKQIVENENKVIEEDVEYKEL